MHIGTATLCFKMVERMATIGRLARLAAECLGIARIALTLIERLGRLSEAIHDSTHDISIGTDLNGVSRRVLATRSYRGQDCR